MPEHYSLLTYQHADKSIYAVKSRLYGQDKSLFNIGDYIQSLAAKQYLPYVSHYIDRDGFAYENIETNIIMNGWYYIYDGNRFIPDSFNALLTSIYIKNPETVPTSFLKSIMRLQPIGCRDIATRNFFRSKGIDAYFPSCLTTTLHRSYKNDTKRSGIIFCDFPLYYFKKEDNITLSRKRIAYDIIKKYKYFFRYLEISKIVKKLLKNYSDTIEYVRHEYERSIPHQDRFLIAHRLLEKYATAELVFTTRIHCALPCLSLGTPVVLLVPSYDEARYSGLSDFFNIIGFDKNGKFINDITIDNNKIINKNTHKKKANLLETSCLDFIKNCTDINYNTYNDNCRKNDSIYL